MTYPGESRHFDFPADLALPTLGPTKPGVTGIVPARNWKTLDYCADLAVGSLLGCSDEVIYCDSDSTDGSLEFMQEWASREPKIRIINYPWPNPCGDMWLLPKWINFARLHARYSTCVQLDADEVMHPSAFPRIRENGLKGRSQWFRRLNFWRSAHWIAPHGTVCSHLVVRQNRTELEAICDGHYIKGETTTMLNAQQAIPACVIYHLGFCRKNDAFFAKSKVVQHALVNTYDAKLAQAEKDGVPWDAYSPFAQPLIKFTERDYPPLVVEYHNARGF